MSVSVPSRATEIASAPISGVGGNFCDCHVTSLSNKTHDLLIEQVAAGGNVVAFEASQIQPGGTQSLLGSCGSNNPNYCRVSGKFPRKKIRAVYCVTASTTEGICVPLQ